MKDNQRDALTHLGIALTSFGLIKSGFLSGWAYGVIAIGAIVFAISAVYEFFFNKS